MVFSGGCRGAVTAKPRGLLRPDANNHLLSWIALMNSSRNVNDLAAFFAVAREKSFTRGGTVGVTQSALSHTIRGLEQRLGDASKDQA
jgi:hypothetical protein